ncbi:hypothetical protein [Streptomyces sp. MST-110588]|uniref:hypothetical protein n=1 Tax=Streptomyces sp. MST-110588 TaxID=2833628 RepID=UPI001F5C1334|nr:hypothetical protein [Streptomyces sp. MST-110588]UNO42548.1 hypothetical protein KGS77_27240 [Streptomyces sp. MST-110588]
MVERSPRDPRDPLDEEAAWAEIVAAYGEEPVFPVPDDGPVANGPVANGPADAGQRDGGRAKNDPAHSELPRTELPHTGLPTAGGPATSSSADTGTPKNEAPKNGSPESGAWKTGAPQSDLTKKDKRDQQDLPGGEPSKGGPVGGFVVFAPGVGPRDWEAAEPSEDDFDEQDEGHFTPPEPPPLPQADVTAKFAWLAVLGGPLLLVLMVLFRQPVTWWITVLGIGGFLGGFATLVARMKHDDEDDEGLPGGGAVV